ncbi:MAG: O-methyltransferase [Tissierellia bacterium]|nr:O-methyltransferase [Tissierellia bacterium]
MSYILEGHVEEYIKNLLREEEPFEKELRNYAIKYHIPILDQESTMFLRFFLNVLKPKRVLELGTAIGYSALVMCKIVPELEEIITVELREDMYRLAKDNIKKANVNKIKVLNMDALEALDLVEGPFDFIFIDAAKGQYKKYFKKSEKLLSKDGVILCDNVLFRGMISNPSLVKRRKITIVKRLRTFLYEIFQDPKWDTTLVPLGDGMLLARRNYEEG